MQISALHIHLPKESWHYLTYTSTLLVIHRFLCLGAQEQEGSLPRRWQLADPDFQRQEWGRGRGVRGRALCRAAPRSGLQRYCSQQWSKNSKYRKERAGVVLGTLSRLPGFVSMIVQSPVSLFCRACPSLPADMTRRTKPNTSAVIWATRWSLAPVYVQRLWQYSCSVTVERYTRVDYNQHKKKAIQHCCRINNAHGSIV